MVSPRPPFGPLGENRLAYEQLYGLLSAHFLHLCRAGELPDDLDFHAWAWLCEQEGIEPEDRTQQ